MSMFLELCLCPHTGHVTISLHVELQMSMFLELCFMSSCRACDNCNRLELCFMSSYRACDNYNRRRVYSVLWLNSWRSRYHLLFIFRTFRLFGSPWENCHWHNKNDCWHIKYITTDVKSSRWMVFLQIYVLCNHKVYLCWPWSKRMHLAQKG